MKRLALLAGFVVSDLLFLFFTWQFLSRFSHPYEETGKFFSEKEGLVYREESILTYGLLTLLFLLGSFALFLWLRKQKSIPKILFPGQLRRNKKF